MMVKKSSNTAARINDKSSSFRSDQSSVSQVQQFMRTAADDDIILSLANAYENKRARQVTEWERVQAARASSTYRSA